MTEETDEETERLLAEMEEQDRVDKEERAQLEEEATRLGVVFRPNIGTDKLRERVEAARPATPEPEDEEPEQDEDEEPFTVTNVGPNPRRVGRMLLQTGDSYTLTELDITNDIMLLKIQRAIDLGLLVRE